MTTRAEARAEEEAKHRWRALVLVIICAAVAVAYTVFIVLMSTHMPNTLAEADGVTGAWSTNVTKEWDHLVVTHTGDLSKGNMDWEITKGKDNETLASGTHEEHGDDLIAVTIDGSGDFGVYLTPTGVNSAKSYDVTVRELYLSPTLIENLRLSGFFVLALLVPFLWYAFMSSSTEKHREEYRLAWMAIPLTMLLSAIFAFTPWM